jgi:alpha-1,3-rhamnosyl/mannosyltransferase
LVAEKRLVVAYDGTPERLGGGGVARYCRDLRLALERRGDVDLRPVKAPAVPAGVPLARPVDAMVRELAWYPVGLGAWAFRIHPGLIHCTGPLVPLWCPAPWVMTVHDLLPLSHPQLFTRANASHFRYLVARRARRAHRILVGSVHVRDEVVATLGVQIERISVTPWGVDARFRPRGDGQDELRARLGIPPGPFLLAVGTLEPRKNLRTLLRAFAEVRRRGSPCSLVVVGGAGWRAADIEADLGRASTEVVRTGYVGDDDLVVLYSACACFVFPSLHEGFGFPILEAMACGAPVVCSDRSSLPEVAGQAALLVDPLDAGAIADAIEAVLRDPERAARMRAAGLAHSASFSWQRCAELTVEAYRAATAAT